MNRKLLDITVKSPSSCIRISIWQICNLILRQMQLSTGHDFFPLEQTISHPVTRHFRKPRHHVVQLLWRPGADISTRRLGFDTR